MARVKTAIITRKKHKKVLKLAKGFRGSRSKLYRPANNFVMKALKNAKGFIRHELMDRVDIRHIPELEFVYDESIEYGKKIENIIEEIHMD